MDDKERAAIAVLHGNVFQDLERISQSLRTYLDGVSDKLLSAGAILYPVRVEVPRVKKLPSVLRVLDDLESGFKSFWDIDDLVGLRLVTAILPEARAITKEIGDSPPPGVVGGVQGGELSLQSGYRAFHLKFRQPHGGDSVGCEFQIRTALQDAWAVVSRADLYGTKAVELLPEVAQIQAQHIRAVDLALELITFP